MSKFYIKCFKSGAELLSSEIDGSRFLEIDFCESYRGHVCLGRLSSPMFDKKCILDLGRLEDGDYEPILVLEDSRIALPKIQKINGIIMPKDYSMNYLRRLSIEYSTLNERLDALEAKHKTLEEKVYGPGILGRRQKGKYEEK